MVSRTRFPPPGTCDIGIRRLMSPARASFGRPSPVFPSVETTEQRGEAAGAGLQRALDVVEVASDRLVLRVARMAVGDRGHPSGELVEGGRERLQLWAVGMHAPQSVRCRHGRTASR